MGTQHQLHFLIQFANAQADGALPQALADVTPALPSGSFAGLSDSGARFVVNLSPGVDTMVAAKKELSHSWPRVLATVDRLGSAEITFDLAAPDSGSYVDLGITNLLDAEIVAHLSAWALGWQYLAQAPYARLHGPAAAPLVLSRYSTIAALLLGHLAVMDALPTVQDLVERADTLPYPGDWTLMTHSASQAALSYGPAAIFEPGEILDIAVVSHAFTAVATVALLTIAEQTSTSPSFVVELLAHHGPSVDLVRLLSRS